MDNTTKIIRDSLNGKYGLESQIQSANSVVEAQTMKTKKIVAENIDITLGGFLMIYNEKSEIEYEISLELEDIAKLHKNIGRYLESL